MSVSSSCHKMNTTCFASFSVSNLNHSKRPSIKYVAVITCNTLSDPLLLRSKWMDPCSSKYILIYIGTTPPPLGLWAPWAYTQVWGTIGSGLTPRVRILVGHSRFPALISVGGADRFLEDLSLDTRGVQSAQMFRFFKEAYCSTGAYPIPII